MHVVDKIGRGLSENDLVGTYRLYFCMKDIDDSDVSIEDNSTEVK